MASSNPKANYSATSPSIPPPPLSPNRNRTISSSSSNGGSSSNPRPNSTLRSPRLQSSPILLKRLPPTSSINKESIYASELELDKQIRQISKERQLQEALQDQLYSVERSKVRDEQGTWSNLQLQNQGPGGGKGKSDGDGWGNSQGFKNEPQAFELYKAIDSHDIDYIMRIRDHKFYLLLNKNNGNEFPIVYATRLGDQYRDIVILLVGALSRYVNHLDPEDFEKKETLRALKALRVNLKLAIDHTLKHLPPGHSPILLSSYLQVLIMSEGDAFLHRAINDISLVLRSTSSDAKPVKESEAIIRKFCTKELRGVKDGVGDVEEYIANAVLDLVIMSAWSLVASQLGLENLLTHTFARDLRTYAIFNETLESNLPLMNKLNPRLKRMLFTLRDLAGNSKKSVRGRLNDVQSVLDNQS